MITQLKTETYAEILCCDKCGVQMKLDTKNLTHYVYHCPNCGEIINSSESYPIFHNRIVYDDCFVSERIKRARKNANLTQKQIADKLGIFQSNYSTYEKDRVPSKERLKQIAQICGVPMDYFKGGNN